MLNKVCLLVVASTLALSSKAFEFQPFDVVIVGGTPGGIMAGIGAARMGKTVVILDRTSHIGGLPANGLGATDIHTRGGTGGLFVEFVTRLKKHYVDKYGTDSEQVKICSDGYHFEPSVAEKIFEEMLAEYPKITVRKMRQFDSKPDTVRLEKGAISVIRVINRENGAGEYYTGKVFIDATYEGDLAAAAGAPWRTRREGKAEYNEPLAGRVYKLWGSKPNEVGEGSTFEGDDTIQAFNYRVCLTQNTDRIPIAKPANYNRAEFVSLIEDVKQNRRAGPVRAEKDANGIGFIVNMVFLPNGKTDANNQHLAFLSTDLPEENYPWPTADWAWRDKYAQRLRDYTLGLIWFAQNDPELPEAFRANCKKWGLSKDEYTDNQNFPRQVYVREGRRIEGEHLFTAHDALPKGSADARPPVYATSITASHYALDSHAIRKREPNRIHLDGFISHPTKPYTVPYGVIVPKKVEQLLTPVPVSGTHIGFSTLRMEPCWMALGQAAGVAAAISIDSGKKVRDIDVATLQTELLKQKAVLIYYKDVPPTHENYDAAQFFGVRGLLPEWEAKLAETIDQATFDEWTKRAGVKAEKKATRGETLQAFYNEVKKSKPTAAPAPAAPVPFP